MNKDVVHRLALVTVSLTLSACGRQVVEVERIVEKPVEKIVEKPVDRIVTVEGELPLVPIRTRAEKPDCGAAAGAAGRTGAALRDFRARTFVPLRAGMAAQAADLPDNLQTALFGMRTLLNREYNGPGSADRQALHAKYEKLFRSAYPNAFASYAQDERTDALMVRYADEMDDGHTYFIPNAYFAALKASFENSAEPAPSFGLDFSTVPGADGAVLRSVRHDGPAFAAGLRRGDVILAVNGVTLSRESTSSATYVKYATLLAEASGGADPAVFLVSRAGEQREVTVRAAVLGGSEAPWGEVRTTPGGKKVLYLVIPTFLSLEVAERVHALVRAASGAGVEGVVVNLRDNGGGYVIMNDGAAGAFTDKAIATTFETLDANDVTYGYSDGAIRVFNVCGDRIDLPLSAPTLWKGRTAVLLNGRSASGSEFFARSVSTLAGARLIGTRTAGVANSSTNVYELPGERAVAVTDSVVRGPDGRVLPDAITPDEEVADDMAKLAAGTDAPLKAALDWLDR
ncbi:S41 family peptidase [Deinococcus pimensis]|uniref:S41 family peptidase n=1 Tax=Deinococcus pimensis TaxID=309888 RepID=UPI00047FD1DD|nr:S41 family peptidase [Deinococcus pimensis]